MKKTPTLTDPQLAMLDVLWARGEATVAEVTAALAKRHSSPRPPSPRRSLAWRARAW